MKLNGISMQRRLRFASALIGLGLIVELISLSWFHPLSFALFAFVAAVLVGLGILVFLVSLAFAVTPTAGNRS